MSANKNRDKYLDLFHDFLVEVEEAARTFPDFVAAVRRLYEGNPTANDLMNVVIKLGSFSSLFSETIIHIDTMVKAVCSDMQNIDPESINELVTRLSGKNPE